MAAPLKDKVCQGRFEAWITLMKRLGLFCFEKFWGGEFKVA